MWKNKKSDEGKKVKPSRKKKTDVKQSAEIGKERVQNVATAHSEPEQFIEATTKLHNDTLTYTVKGNTKPVALIMKNMETMNLPPLVNTKACIRCQEVDYLNVVLKSHNDEAPADFVEGTGTTEKEDDLEVNIL